VNAALFVLRNDLRLAWRDRAGWLAASAFAAISVLTYSFAFDLATSDVRPLLPGVLWTTFLFAGTFASSQSFRRETEQGTFDALLLAPVPPTALYLSKVASNVLALLVLEVALLLLATILFGTTLITPELVLIVLIGTAGYVALTTLLAATTVPARSGTLLLPVLSLPLLIPVLIAAVRATGGTLGLETGGAPWIVMLAVFALWSSLGAVLLFPMVAVR
jgi:heme exporter protein B